MDNRIILTIGRQFGSGGREIGQKLAKALGISYYDKELITMAAKESGLCEDVFEQADERASNGLAYAFTMGYSYMSMFTPFNDILSNDALFKLQSDAIRKLAETESCVLVGRCADYILRDDPACLSFFVHNTMENRIQRIIQRQPVTVEQAKELMTKTDKSRAAYYNYYTNKAWGVASSYNLSIDASVLGIDDTVTFMKSFVEKKQSMRPPHFG
ncbi:AAA family ATPase [Parabacteroides bouchesdurhonensis]|uniref:cytidylate kinase-like family protein n=1 Tax=Parabacteroides bouchesdurhonensis TaxID=1936995 RepID=UPI000E4F648C|nr:cytidylate kinase-like family protein [Parabacteroides bouchesdurhonensis]RHJ95422.1 cytidylate kinase-like family protein [Bacteroides sp. AM07-16]